MRNTLPGTLLPLSPKASHSAFSELQPIFTVSGGGLLLSQVTELTGLGATTIQNWVKRGWVPNPVGRKYNEQAVARILLVHLLHQAMKLEDIAKLLQYINGCVNDVSDDIIPETTLYNRLCSAILELENSRNYSHESIIALTTKQLESYDGPVPDAKERLTTALSIMLMNVAASMLMDGASALFRDKIAFSDKGSYNQST